MKKTQPWPGRIAFATIRVSQPGCQSAGVIDDPLAIDAKATGLSTVMRDATGLGTFVNYRTWLNVPSSCARLRPFRWTRPGFGGNSRLLVAE